MTIIENPVDVALTDFGRANAAETTRLRSAIEVEKEKLTRLQDSFSATWGTTWTRKQHDNKFEYEAAHATLVESKRPILAKLAELKAALEDVPYKHEAGLRAIATTVMVGPDISVPTLQLAPAEDDAHLRGLARDRDAAVDAHAKLTIDRDVFGELLREAVAHAASVDVRVRHGLGSTAEAAAANKAQRDTQRAHEKAIAGLATLEGNLRTLDEQIARRREVLGDEQAHRITREIEEAAFPAADALVAAMSAMTRLRRALDASHVSTNWWTLSTLNADDPRSAGREFLQLCLEAGWVAKTRHAG